MADEYNNRRPLILSVTITLMALSVLFVSLRFYSKIVRKIIRVDDWLILAALFFTLAVLSAPLILIRYGLGLRLGDVDPTNFPVNSKVAYVSTLLYPTTVGLTKVSILFNYLSLFPSSGNRKFCYGVTGFVSVYTVLCLVLSLVECRPIEAVWDKSIKGECLNLDAIVYVGAGLNAAIDLVVYLWPIRPLWKLQLPSKQRFGLVALFSMGVIVCVVGITRIYFLSKLLEDGDFLWNGVPIYIASNLEVSLGVICACLTSVKPAMAMLFPTFFASTAHKSGTNSRSYMHHGGTRTGHRHTGIGSSAFGGTAARAESFAFEQLSSKQRDHHHGDHKSDFEVTTATVRHMDNPGAGNNNNTNGVWVNISNDQRARQQNVPANAIGVSQEITVDNHVVVVTKDMAPRGLKDKPSDTGSEEWIFDGEDERGRSRQV